MDDKVEVTATEASGGSRRGPMRIVLVTSVVLVVIAFVIIYRIYG